MSGEASQDIDSGTGQVVTPAEPVSHVDVEDGVSVGHHAEPENIESSDGNQPPTETPDADAPPPEPPPKERLEDIYAKAKAGRSAEMEEDVANMTEEGRLEHLQRLEAEAGGRPDPFAEDEQPPADPPVEPNTAGDPPVVPTETNTPPVPPAATPQVATVENPPEGIDPANETTTITVYGMQEQVPTAEVNAAGGIDAYQKNRAADIKMERAATYEASLREYESQLSDRAASIEQGSQTPAQPGTGSTESSPTDAQGDTADVDALAQIVTDAVYSGDREETQKQLSSALASVRSDAIRTVQTQVSQSAPSGPTAEQQAAEAQSRKEANAVFLTEFPELNTPVLRDATFNMVKQVAADPVMIGRPLSEVTREACNRVRGDVFPNAAPSAPVATPVAQSPAPLISAPGQPNPATDLASRLNLKRRTVVTPTNEAHGRVVEPSATEQRPPTNAEVVANMRKARGQPA